MRYYRVVITDPTTNEILVPNYNGIPGFTRVGNDTNISSYTSLNYGQTVTAFGSTNMSAQMVEVDIPVGFLHQPGQNAYIKIHGVGIAEIGQAADLQGMNIAVYGGMAAGLPLANPLESGLLVNAMVLQSFGIWLGHEQSLNMFMTFQGSSPTSNQTSGNPSSTSTVPVPTTNENPANIVFQWRPGQPLLTPVVNTLQVAYPKYSIAGAVHSGLVWSGATATGYFNTLEQFSAYLYQKSLSIISGYAPINPLPQNYPSNYPGVRLALQNNTITIQDGTTQTTPKQIQFIDLVGQPTWSQRYQVQVTCVMRADINCGDYVRLPPSPGITTLGSNSEYFNPSGGNIYATAKDSSIFSGVFEVIAVRHVGNNRDPNAQSWVTTLDLLNMSYGQPEVVDTLPVLYNGPTGGSAYSFYLPS